MATDNRNPTSDESVTGTWSGSSGSRYTLVNDHPDSSSTTSLTQISPDGKITFGFSGFSIPTGSTINSVYIQYYDYKTSFFLVTIGGRLKVGGSYYDASEHGLARLAITLRTDTWTTNPATGSAWTVNQVNGVGANALQAFGLASLENGGDSVIGSIRITVDYTPGSSSVYNFMWGVI
jgi:hypothetical protein